MPVKARRAREIARTRQDILEAAARAFVQSGFKAATMQDIAKEAGYTAASLYSYFSSKEEILTGLRQLVLEELGETFGAPVPDGLSLRQKLELLFRRQLEFAQRRFALFATLQAGAQMEGCEEAQASDGARSNAFEARLDLYVQFLGEHATPEDLGGHEPRELALTISGMSFVFFYEWMRGGHEYPIQDRIPKLLDLIFHGISGPRSP